MGNLVIMMIKQNINAPKTVNTLKNIQQISYGFVVIIFWSKTLEIKYLFLGEIHTISFNSQRNKFTNIFQWKNSKQVTMIDEETTLFKYFRTLQRRETFYLLLIINK